MAKREHAELAAALGFAKPTTGGLASVMGVPLSGVGGGSGSTGVGASGVTAPSLASMRDGASKIMGSALGLGRVFGGAGAGAGAGGAGAGAGAKK